MTSSTSTVGFDASSLEKRLESNPLSPVFARLASLYLSANRLEEARNLCEKGVTHYPQYSTGHLILGQCYMRLGILEGAREELQRTLSLEPRCDLARTLLTEATLRLEAEKVDKVTVADEQMIADTPEDEILTSTLAEIYAAQGAYREAIRTYSLLSRRKPEERERFELRMRELVEKWRALGLPS